MRLTISNDGRYFQKGGKPFFWLGDTAWMLFQKLTPAQTRTYLENRAAKGFTVIQATLAHTKGYQNRGGSPALLEDDFSRPNPDRGEGAFWPQVEGAVRRAAELGLYMALLPSWGSLAKQGLLNAKNAGAYTDFLASRFAGYDNIIWLVGGDVRGGEAEAAFDAVGEGLRRKCPGHLIGFHPFGRCSSSQWFHGRDWLDFNMFQSGHRDYTQLKLNAWDDKVDAETFVGEDSYRYVRQDRSLSPAKPTLDGEPSYELIPHGLHDPSQPYWQACDVRRYAYWSLLSGAAGHTYGDNAIMQFYDGEGKGSYGVLETWDVALHDPGSMHMSHVRRVMEAVRWQEGGPAQALLPDNREERYAYNAALQTPVAACVYSYSGAAFTVRTAALPYQEIMGYWFDPVSGGVSALGPAPKAEAARFVPPDRRVGQNDWLLLLVNAEEAGAFLTWSDKEAGK